MDLVFVFLVSHRLMTALRHSLWHMPLAELPALLETYARLERLSPPPYQDR